MQAHTLSQTKRSEYNAFNTKSSLPCSSSPTATTTTTVTASRSMASFPTLGTFSLLSSLKAGSAVAGVDSGTSMTKTVTSNAFATSSVAASDHQSVEINGSGSGGRRHLGMLIKGLEMKEEEDSESRDQGGDTSVGITKIQDLLMFKDDEHLRRASRLCTVLRRGGRIFRNNKGNASTYRLSNEVQKIDAFVSHNWAVSRWRKFLCLALHFNYFPTAMAVCMWSILIAILGAADLLPVVDWEIEGWYKRTVIGRVTIIPLAFFVLFFCREFVGRNSCLAGPTIFLDKTCIHQENQDVQRKGIEKLGAFLYSSETMLVCYTDLYLTKLWTVYEVASFLSLFPVGRMKLLHAHIPVTLLVAAGCMYIVDMLGLWATTYTGTEGIEVVLLPLGFVPMVWVMRHLARSKARMRENLDNFSVHNCNCFVEADRALVHENISHLIRQVLGMEDLPQEEALDTFNQIVRTELPTAMGSLFGRLNLQYRYIVVLPFLCYVDRIPDATSAFAHGMPFRYFVVGHVMWYCTVIFAFGPAVLALLQSWAGTRMHLTGCREWAWLLCGVIVTGVSACTAYFSLLMLHAWALVSNIGIAVFGVVGSSLALAVYVLISDRFHRKKGEEPTLNLTVTQKIRTSQRLADEGMLNMMISVDSWRDEIAIGDECCQKAVL